MTETLVHRGPDAGDLWLDPEAGLAIGHRRLSIVDLSPAGAQPMVSSCGRFVISYNGEVYNADDLRPELEAAGQPVGAYDVLLAGQARRRGATLVTSNVREFERVAGLKWEDWA